MKNRITLYAAGLLAISLVCHARSADETGFVSIFDGKSLGGWRISAQTGHSRASNHQSGGRWVVEDGAIIGSQDIPGNGGIVITEEPYGDFEIALEMNNDFGPDSGLFLRSTENGRAYQCMIDYHSGGNLMGLYGEGLGAKPHVRNLTSDAHRNKSFRPTIRRLHCRCWRSRGLFSGGTASGMSCAQGS
jgi:hypothetical protein